MRMLTHQIAAEFTLLQRCHNFPRCQGLPVSPGTGSSDRCPKCGDRGYIVIEGVTLDDVIAKAKGLASLWPAKSP